MAFRWATFHLHHSSFSLAASKKASASFILSLLPDPFYWKAAKFIESHSVALWWFSILFNDQRVAKEKLLFQAEKSGHISIISNIPSNHFDMADLIPNQFSSIDIFWIFSLWLKMVDIPEMNVGCCAGKLRLQCLSRAGLSLWKILPSPRVE